MSYTAPMSVERRTRSSEHLSEPVRLQIARDYIKQDLRKILPSLRGSGVWSPIDGDINRWFESSSPVAGLRDFWNRFDGVAMGGKLKVGLLQVITAENIHWEAVKRLPLDEKLASGGGLGYMAPGLDKRRLRASELRTFSQQAGDEFNNQWRKTFAEHAATSESRDHFPIIVMEEVDNRIPVLLVHDGNRRMAQAVLAGQTTIPAYVGRYTTPDKRPRNFWLPTSFLMELVKQAEILDSYEAYQYTLGLLRGYKPLSDSGRDELLERVLIGSNPVRQRLKADLTDK